MDSPSEISRQMTKGNCKKCTPNIAVDDKAGIEHANEERRGQGGGHEGSEWNEAWEEQALGGLAVRPVRPF